MMCPPKYYFLIKLHNLEEIRPSQILRLLKRYKAADCSICIYVSVLRLLKRYKAADRSICIYDVSASWGVPSVESSRSVWGLGKGVSGKPYPRLCNARRP